LLAARGLLDNPGGREKVAAYDDAVRRGALLPPVSVIALAGKLYLEDGAHRCTVAAIQGRRTISAIVYRVDSWAEADAVGVRLSKLEAAGTPWQLQARAVEQLLAV
jgi:hypothetical protein